LTGNFEKRLDYPIKLGNDKLQLFLGFGIIYFIHYENVIELFTYVEP